MGDEGRPLALTDRPVIDAALAGGAFRPAEHAFANLWLFRHRHDYRLHDRPAPHLRGTTYDGRRHALPLGTIDRDTAHALLDDGVDLLFPIGEEGPGLAAAWGLGIAHDPADSDYWYDAAALATLHGARTRRQQAAAFAAEAPVAVPWQQTLAAAAHTILDGWSADVDRAPDDGDAAECRAALALSGRLGLEGLVVRTGRGEPVAFLLASRSGDARIVHFAKGRRAHSGAYPWMFARYARTSGARWLNFEQDLGKPGFAQAKRAYAPVRHQPKFRLFRDKP